MLRAVTYSLVIVQGATLREQFVWKAAVAPGQPPTPLDLTGWHGRALFWVAGQLALTLASPDAGVALGADGKIVLHASQALVLSLPVGAGRWVLEVNPPGGDVDVLIHGDLTVTTDGPR